MSRIAGAGRFEEPAGMKRAGTVAAAIVLIGTITLIALIFLGNRVEGRLGPLCPAPSAVQVCPQVIPS